MGIEDLSPQLQQFVQRHINSVEQLEVLLLLHANPATEWSSDEVAQRIYTSPDAARTRLIGLVSSGAVESNSGSPARFQYKPATDELRAIIDALAHAYQERRVSIIALIYAKPPKAIRAFSDAFRLFDAKPKPSDGKDPGKEGS